MEVVVDPTGKSARWHALDSGSPGGLWVCKLSRNIWGTPLDACLRPRAVQAIPSGSRSPSTKSSGQFRGASPKSFGQFRAVVSGSLGRVRKFSIEKGPLLPQKVSGSFGQFREALSGIPGQHSWAFLGSSFGHPWGGVLGIRGEQF